MTHGSLFSGIGGFDLAVEWMGWQNVFHCEWNPFGQKVLKYYWPEAESFTDITKTDFTKYANKIDILTGGFPCQPYSAAGKRLGKADERHLWPEMCRAIREIEPTYIVGENVRGLLNWNGGMVFDEVCAELEALGYQVAPCLIPACGVGAPHRRERIWFVAYNNSFRFKRYAEQIGDRSDTTQRDGIDKFCEKQGWDEIRSINEGNSESRIATNSTSSRRVQTLCQRKSGQFNEKSKNNNWQNFPTESPICNGDDGLSDRLDSITFPKWRNESIKAGGNAIVPQVAFQIFKAIEQINKQNDY